MSGANKVYLNAQLAELAFLQAREDGLRLSAWVSKVVEEKLVQLGEEARAAAAPPPAAP